MANIFDQFDTAPQANVFDQFDSAPAQPGTTPSEPLNGSDEGFLPDSAKSAIGGVNSLAPTIAGLPMDTTVNLANLGIAGYGMAKQGVGQALGYKPHEIDMPEPIDPSKVWLSSGWLKNKGEEAMGPVFSPASDEPLQQDIHRAASILGAGAMAPAAGVKQAAANVARMTPSVVGEYAGRKLFPDQPLAPIAGMLVAPAVASKLGSKVAGYVDKKAAEIATKRAQSAIKDAILKESQKAGYVVTPSLAHAGMGSRALEGLSGLAKTKQLAQIKNQKITESLVRKEFGLPDDVPLSRELMQGIRKESFQRGYAPVRQAGTVKADAQYAKDLDSVTKQYTGAARSFPDAVSDDVTKLANNIRVKSFDSGDAVDMIQNLRDTSSKLYAQGDKGLGKASRKLAEALEGQLERHLSAQGNADALAAFKNARVNMAKTHTVEDAINGGMIDAKKIGAMYAKGKPLSGNLETIGKFANTYNDVVGIPKSGYSNPLTVLDYFTMGGGAGLANPYLASIPAARMGARYGIMSQPYQKAFVTPSHGSNMYMRLLKSGVSPGEINRIMALPKESQAAAMAIMLEQLNQSQEATPQTR